MGQDRDVDVLARTLWGEARGEGAAGMVAVGWTIRNRAAKPGWWGRDIVSVCQAPWQFSCWNKNDPNYPYLSGAKQIPAGEYLRAREAALAVISGSQPDPTGGATHYYATTMAKPPAWAAKAKRTATIGRHVFFRDVP
jgi:spore germination cell wall hydrolase CwlJ-like protein